MVMVTLEFLLIGIEGGNNKAYTMYYTLLIPHYGRLDKHTDLDMYASENHHFTSTDGHVGRT